tara:strand:+ start:932 stop:1978 length:1047 start_codon:yes stop_codon:yes gene_type:complete
MGGNGNGNRDGDGKQKRGLNFGKMSLKMSKKLKEGLTKTLKGLFEQSEEDKRKNLQEQIDKFKKNVHYFLSWVYLIRYPHFNESKEDNIICDKPKLKENFKDSLFLFDIENENFYPTLLAVIHSLIGNRKFHEIEVPNCSEYQDKIDEIKKIFISFLNGLLDAMKTGKKYKVKQGHYGGLNFDNLKLQEKLQEYENLLNKKNFKYEIKYNSITDSKDKPLITDSKGEPLKKLELKEIIEILAKVSDGAIFDTEQYIEYINLVDFLKYVIIILTYLQDKQIETLKIKEDEIKEDEMTDYESILYFLGIKYKKSNSPAEGGKRKQKRNFSVKKKTKTKTSRKKRSRKLKR